MGLERYRIIFNLIQPGQEKNDDRIIPGYTRV